MSDNKQTKATLVLGASVHAHRYSYLATEQLLSHGHSITLVGKSKGELFGLTEFNSPAEESHLDCREEEPQLQSFNTREAENILEFTFGACDTPTLKTPKS